MGHNIILEQNKIVEHIHNIFTVPCKKYKMVSFDSSIMKNIVVLTASSVCCLLKSIAMIL